MRLMAMMRAATAAMSTEEEHKKLLELIAEALKLSDKLSNSENDYYARCSNSLDQAYYEAMRMA